MGVGSIWHWVIVLVIVLLVFGTKKMKNIGTDLGAAIKGFKEGIKSNEQEAGRPPSDDSIQQVIVENKPVSPKEMVDTKTSQNNSINT